MGHMKSAFFNKAHDVLHERLLLSSFESITSFEDIVLRYKAPATCGELVQGAIDGQDFLVNCPIDLYAFASLHKSIKPGVQVREAERFGKLSQGIELLTARQTQTRGPLPSQGLELLVASDVPRGKGMASSSADLAAALSIVADGLNMSLSARELSTIIAQIEPSDSVHLPGISHVNQLTGDVHACLPAPQDLSVLVVDCGGELDTVNFDREQAHEVYCREQPKLRYALSTLKAGLRDQDLKAVAHAATLSSKISQSILYKPQFEELLVRGCHAGALGVNCAHSGTVLGVLHRTSDGISESLSNLVERHFGSTLQVLGCHQVISGGCHAY